MGRPKKLAPAVPADVAALVAANNAVPQAEAPVLPAAPLVATSHAPVPVVPAAAFKVEGDPTAHVVVHHHSHTYHGPHKRVFSHDVHGKNFVQLAQSFASANPQPPALANAGEKNHLEFISESEANGINQANAEQKQAIDDRRQKQRLGGQRVTP